MKKILVSLIIFVFTATHLWSGAHFAFKGEDLSAFSLEFTKGEKGLRHDKEWMGMYKGYVIGVWHANANGKMIETPDSVTGKQICKVVAKYLEDHPEEHHHAAYTLIIRAVNKAFGPKPLPQKFVTQ